MTTEIQTTPSPASLDAAPLADLYRTLLAKAETELNSTFDERAIRLRALGDLHFLDAHACLLLARARHTPTLILRQPAATHLCARIYARIICVDAEAEELYDYYDPAGGEGLDYAPGVLLRRLLDVHHWSHLWHNYLTSRDCALPRPSAGATLDGKFPHLRTGLITGVDLFNCGEFYQAHEDWEALWMRLDAGAERSLAQGLIQLGGAHIHRLKARPHEANKLFASARRHLEEAAAIDWIDAHAIILESQRIFATKDVTDIITLPSIPLRSTHTSVARKHQ